MCTKVAVVTGGNKGIGFGIVRGLCKRFDGIVYLTSRNEKLGRKAVDDLKREGLHPKYHQLDITVPRSVEALRDHLRVKYSGIDVLVNNAGITMSYAPVSMSEKAEKTIFVNYFSLLSTCNILFPLLRKGARVVNLSSLWGHLSRIPSKKLVERFQDPNLTVLDLSELMAQYVAAVKQGNYTSEWGNSAYVVSKVGVTALTKIHQRLLNDRHIKVNAVNPGYVKTDMTSHEGFMSIDEGAEAALFLALDAPDNIRGEYVWYNKKVVDWSGEIPQ
ncbi:carbonyl reductase [NADPH] 3-like [Danaus plexippus]|uniref:carbonyl reductase [NADPH] 3-like n=1 Tax=Danaus plexippus TaxID=13037 RepID=UPI002AB1CAFC|nr:carbonyl reductase [NADPH] 3-like [Danaus plexippus]